MNIKSKNLIEINLFILCLFAISFYFYGPIYQWANYHDFADKRDFCGIPNFLDVSSNSVFLVIGLMMLKNIFKSSEQVMYYGMSISLILLFLGSAYYHWSPDDIRLVYDRLPIASFFSILFIYINEKIQLIQSEYKNKIYFSYWLLSVLSVLIWSMTGDLRFYAVAQFFPLVMILIYFMVGFLDKKESIFAKNDVKSYAILIIGYGIAKAFESLDYEILSMTQGLISGHTIKHMIAGLTVGLYFYHDDRIKKK